MNKTEYVYFRNRIGEDICIGSAKDVGDVAVIVKKFLDKNNYISYYTRTWVVDDKKWLDVGSHTEFFWHKVFEI